MRKLLLIFLCLALAPALFGQTVTSGDIIGTVLDPQGAVVPTATVTARNIDTGATQTAKANGQGAYRFAELKPGRYELTASAGGFQPTKQSAVVAVGGTTNANIQLGLQGSTQTVEVTAETPLVSITPNNLSTFDRIQVEQVPNSGQDLTSIAQTSAGAMMNTQGGYGNFEVFGLPGTSNNFTMNGGPENDPYLNLNNSGASNLLLGTNSVSEVSIVTNGYSGQYGRFAGAQYNAITKSGTNQFHGNAKYWWNGSVMNANDWFANNTSTKKPRSNLNQYAASIGGPIIHDKTFFFADYEGYRVVLPTANITYIPTVAYENAVLANLPANGMAKSVPFYQTIFNLYNGAPGAANATNVTTADDPVLGCGDIVNTTTSGTPTTSNLPGIVVAGGAVQTPCARKFTSTVGNFTPEWNFTGRVDHHFSDRDNAFFNLRTDHGTQPTYTDPINSAFNANSIQPDWEGQLSETHVFGANAVNQLILTGSWYSAIFNNVNRTKALQTFPTSIVWGDGLFANLGGENYAFPQGRNITQFGLTDDYSWTRGRHTIKFGGTYARQYVTDAGFGTVTSGEAIPLSMTDFSSGIMDEYTQRYPTRLEQRFRFWNAGLYVQDDFRATPSLKLTLTLRGDHNGNPVCFLDCFSRANGTFQSIAKGSNVPYNSVIQGNLREAFPAVQTILWQPRGGFTWSPTKWNNFVISGGFGLFNDAPPATVISRFYRNAPQVNSFLDQSFSDPFSPAEANNVFTIVNAANTAFVNGFKSGGTFTSINAAVKAATGGSVGFTAPSFSTITGTALTPRYQEWNLKVQQGIGNNMAFSVNYVGNHGIRIPIVNAGYNAFCGPIAATSANPNPGPRCAGAVGSIFPTTRPDAMFGTVSQVEFGATSNYNGLTASFQRRFTSGFSATFNYTWSHALDMVSNGGLLPWGDNSIQTQINPTCLRCNNYGNADYDLRHYISANYVWNVPVKSFVFRGHGPDAIFGGWTVSGNVFWHTGFPYTVTNSLGSSITNYGGTIYGQWLGGIPTDCSSPGTPCLTSTQFGPFKSPTSCAGAKVPTSCPITSFGNMERNQFRGPRFFDTDMSVNKNLPIPGWESARLQLGVNFYNLFNHPNFDIPTHSLNSGTFGTIQGTVAPPTSLYGSFVGAAGSPRLIQLQAKFEF